MPAFYMDSWVTDEMLRSVGRGTVEEILERGILLEARRSGWPEPRIQVHEIPRDPMVPEDGATRFRAIGRVGAVSANIQEEPIHDYQAVLTDLRGQLLRLPEDVKQFAYCFKAFCELWFPGDVSKEITTTRRFALRKPLHYAESVHVEYRVRVLVETRSCYHNDTATDRTLWVEISASPFGTRTERLEWNPAGKKGK